MSNSESISDKAADQATRVKLSEAEIKARRAAKLKEEEAAEKAELMQSLKALYIPFSLFIACCIFAAGAFMVYYEEPAGYAFIATTVVIAITAFICLFKFQNPYRVKGIVPARDTIMESNVVDASPEAGNMALIDPDLESSSTQEAEAQADAAPAVAVEKSPATAGK